MMRVSDPMNRVARQVVGAFALSALAAGAASAQANLSTQGFGYPPGQLSTRALATGGSIAEIDPLSQINPASIAMHGTRIVSFQIEPEFRTVNTGSKSEHTTTARYPNVLIAIPVGGSWVVSAGASTLLDRTATTEFNTTETITGGEQVPMTTTYHVDGAMSDVRLAAGWMPRSWLRLGVGAHAITGHNLVSVTQQFADSSQFSSFNQSLVIGFSGAAASAGVQLVNKDWSLGLSGRAGGTVRASVFDTVLARAKVPTRFGATLAYTGIANSAIAIRTSHDGWSSLDGLGSSNLRANDSWDSSIGADIAGPHIGKRIIFLRGGLRDRTLPFLANGNDVTEKSVTGGLGTTFANGRVLTDFAAVYANRSANISASEHAWTISIGLSVRP
jgi:hypothetical protein